MSRILSTSLLILFLMLALSAAQHAGSLLSQSFQNEMADPGSVSIKNIPESPRGDSARNGHLGLGEKELLPLPCSQRVWLLPRNNMQGE